MLPDASFNDLSGFSPPTPPRAEGTVADSARQYYYLLNFERALTWLGERYDDIFALEERAFLGGFNRLPRASRALLVRMLMRKGALFRASRLSYVEIGCPREAAAPLVTLGWLDAQPQVSLDELFALTTRPELLEIFAQTGVIKSSRKSDLLDALRATHNHTRSFAQWYPQSTDQLFRVNIAPLCERLRLMFFGNLQQDWSEFVLADLGVFQYETVAFAPSSRAFQQRSDVDAYLALHACREALEMMADADQTLALIDAIEAIDSIDNGNAWLATRRAKLLFRVGQHCERLQAWQTALDVYARCTWPGARHRRMRVMERCGDFNAAFALAAQAVEAPENDEERQRVARMMPRLQRRLGHPLTRVTRAAAIERSALVLQRPSESFSVEYVARDHLDSVQAPAYYVENALINSLFGLLCWDAVFSALPGAFFHPFQRGPADLHAPDFHARRAAQFAACFAQLDSGAYRETILRHLASKAGLQSPFVFWGVLTPELVTLALRCFPAAHLKLWFERLLRDIRSNRSGLPDLVRFWPAEQRYELIEVKGPGDRLQDNQIRWLDYCVEHGMPVRVLDVRWDDESIACDGGVAA